MAINRDRYLKHYWTYLLKYRRELTNIVMPDDEKIGRRAALDIIAQDNLKTVPTLLERAREWQKSTGKDRQLRKLRAYGALEMTEFARDIQAWMAEHGVSEMGAGISVPPLPQRPGRRAKSATSAISANNSQPV